MSDPRKTATLTDAQREEIYDRAEHLDYMLSEALREAPSWIDIAADGTTTVTGPDDAAAAEVARTQEKLDEHLRRHRGVLGDEPRFQSYYETIDQAAE